MEKRRRLKHISLFALGCAIGATGLTLSRDGGVPQVSQFLHDRVAQAPNGHEAYACVPQTTNDNIFFISCGGIY
jgi:hypothetical protein